MPIAEFFSGIGETYNVIISYWLILEPEIQTEAGIKDFILGYTNVSESIGYTTMIELH
mgnify:CR=1 FL=1